MIETEDYQIFDNKFIFKPDFNSSIDIYFHLISNHDELIFSDYDDINVCVKTNNIYNKKYHHNCKLSEFNQKIELPINLRNAIFGYYFNQQIELPDNLINLTFIILINS